MGDADKKMTDEIKRLQETIANLKKELDDKDWANRKTNEALKILYKEIEKKNIELSRMDELKSQFVSNVSHEFKNPLAITKEAVLLLSDGTLGPLSAEQKKILDTAARTIARLQRLVMDLLDISKIESGKVKLNKTEFNISDLIDEVSQTYEREIAKKQMTFAVDIDPDMGLITADRDRMSQVVINLLNNAIKYTPEGGSIRITLKGSPNEVRFEIADSGPGIPDEYRQKIFDKFERITTEKQEGTGLGLPIAKDIVAIHGGKLWVESSKGKGSTFIFTLPRK